MTRNLSVVLGLLAVGLLGYAGYRYVAERPAPAKAAVVVEEPDRNLGEQACGAPLSLRFRVRNPSDVPVPVVGLAPG